MPDATQWRSESAPTLTLRNGGQGLCLTLRNGGRECSDSDATQWRSRPMPDATQWRSKSAATLTLRNGGPWPVPDASQWRSKSAAPSPNRIPHDSMALHQLVREVRPAGDADLYVRTDGSIVMHCKLSPPAQGHGAAPLVKDVRPAGAAGPCTHNWQRRG